VADRRPARARPETAPTARDHDALLAEMRRVAPAIAPEWAGHSDETDLGAALLEIFAHMGDILSYYQDRVAAESFLGTARSRRSVIDHLRLIGYSLATAAPASTTLTVTLPAPSATPLTVRPGDAFATTATPTSPSVRFEYVGPSDLEIPVGTTVLELPVEEGRLIVDELLGRSDGTPDQRFPLIHAPLILRSRGAAGLVNSDITLTTRVELDGAVHRDRWTPRPHLAFSPSDPQPPRDTAEHIAQRDFVVEVDADDRATVLFGDGLFGAVPIDGDEIRVTYRVGGGTVGNVAAGAITTPLGVSDLARAGASVTNRVAATGGSDRESIDRAVRQAPAVFRSGARAVTAADYEALALVFPGVGRVRAQAESWNRVTLHVALREGGSMSDLLCANLRAYFEDKRPISVILDVRDVDYLEVYIRARVDVLPFYSRTEVEGEIRAAAKALLAFDEVDFDKPVYLSRVYELIEAVDGVAGTVVDEFRTVRDDGAPAIVEKGKITPSGPQLLHAGYPDGVVLEMSGGF
jgi:hypothetical protein